ncbi:pilus assembly PilX N-terminal domain-containing protein [Geomesophilobacter sediminis]|uniref:Pilus assembly PilX N-terminal domain-containing protein n=1 Tax=Geomesophilobacter sediminis TaxID=2798584 RepID=A0A8J7M2E0_9BACT|nr:pilus assembly PilX N-terminal domain-containing protein [Geomesophilobacter sediminis]MBJ6727445.1 pilus assembly PilX N-terminal domain-containing protein [Geomesophilobacter sediminis]
MPLPAPLDNQKGAALITALMLTTLALVISTALIYSVLMGTHVSATQKRYRSVLAATQGGVEALGQEILPQLMLKTDAATLIATDLQSRFSNIGLQIGAVSVDCLTAKMNLPTGQWSSCSQANQTPYAWDHPDLVFTLKGTDANSGFTISTKIVDTVPGNSDRYAIDLLDQGSSVAGNEEGVHPVHIPALFSISVFGQRQDQTREKARLSVLYSY